MKSGVVGQNGENKVRISEPENRKIKITNSKKTWEKQIIKKEQSFMELWDYNKISNIIVIEVPEREEARRQA